MQFLPIYIQHIHQQASRGPAVRLHTNKEKKNAVPLILPQLKNLNRNSLAFMYHNFFSL